MALNEISEKLKNANAEMREEIIYAEVFSEIKAGYRRDGLWAKALSECQGDISKTEALYIKYRAKTLDDELVKYNNEKLNNVEEEKLKEEKLTADKEEKELELIQQEDGAFGIYLHQYKNKKKRVKNKNFFNSSSRLRFWITYLFLLALVQNSMTAVVPLYYLSMAHAGVATFIVIINIITWIARARDSGINFLWVIAMFIPFLNFISVYLLGVTPTKDLKS